MEDSAKTRKSLKTVAVLGLGSMGLGMAQSLVRAGFAVRGFDVSPKRRSLLAEAGGLPASSAAEAASGADAAVVVVVNAAQAETALFGAEGAAQSLPSEAIILQCATVSPAQVQALARTAEAEGLRLLDSPISGGSRKAAEGALSIMISGPDDRLAAAEPLLQALAAKIFRLGPEIGQASTVKLTNQLLAGVHIAAAAEAMAFGMKAGIDPQALFDVISQSAGTSWMFENRVPHILAGDYRPQSAVDIFVKDLGLVLESGEGVRLPTPIAAQARQMFLAASANGLGREDDSAVVKVYASLAGIDLPKPANES